MKQSDEVQEMNHQRKICAFQKYHQYEQEQNQMDTTYHIQFRLSYSIFLKSEKTKSQIKAHLSYFANSYFCNYKPSPCILREHRVLQNLRKNKGIVITKPAKGIGFVILDSKLYDNAYQEIISDTSKFEMFNEDPTLKREALLQPFLCKLKQKTFLTKLNMINCILLVLLLLVSMLLLKCTHSPLVILSIDFVRLFHLQVLLIIILPVTFVIFFYLQFLLITLANSYLFKNYYFIFFFSN